MAAFWLLQALTGVVLVFRWEIEDALLPGLAAVADPAALGERIEAIGRDGGRVIDLWASSNAATRFDIYYVSAIGADRVMRVDGAGRLLRDADDSGLIAHGAIFDTLTLLHTELLAGEAGSWLVAASGLLLLSSLIVGLRLAWPRAAGWRRALFTRPAGARAARLFSWHRTLGLWAGLLALPFIVAGTLLCFEDGIRERFVDDVPLPSGVSAVATGVAPGAALKIAQSRHRGSTLSALVLPGETEPWYRVRLRIPGDLRRNWGTSMVFVGVDGGRILGDHPAADAPSARKLVDAIYPFHTGQLASWVGRILVLLLGSWLIAMILLGLRLWLTRRASR